MDTMTGIGPVRITTLDGKQMIECWTEREDGRWDESYGYVRVGSLGDLTYDQIAALMVSGQMNTQLIYRGEWSLSEDEFSVRVLGPHPLVPFPSEPECTRGHVCCRGNC